MVSHMLFYETGFPKRHRSITIILLILVISLTACYSNHAEVLDTTHTILQETATEAFTVPRDKSEYFNFILPDGFEIENTTDLNCSIVHDGQVFGGFVLTGLSTEIFNCSEDDALINYLESYVTPPLDYEYMMGYGGGDPSYIEISLNILDMGTRTAHEYQHYLFEKNDECYDMWFDNELIDGETRCQILIITGIDKTAEYIG